MKKVIVWLRDDLRLDDNPALARALAQGEIPIPVYVHAPEEEGAFAPGAASNAWRHRSLEALDASLRARGSRLLALRGSSLDALREVVARHGARGVYWNRRYEPASIARDASVKRALRAQGIEAESHSAALLFEPFSLATRKGGPYKVFGPFFRAAREKLEAREPWDAPARLPSVGGEALDGVSIASLGLAPRLGWDEGFWRCFTPGEQGARRALERFVDEGLASYADARDLPARRGTSRLSPHLRFGELSVSRVVSRVVRARDVPEHARERYLAELGWREFSYHLLYHFPESVDTNLDRRFDDFPWETPSHEALEAWRRGRTGVPIVDAGMRELWQTGFMHNRVRMIVVSYLCKHMRVHWTEGARWFWDTLVDADLANNTQGFQWTAGTGVDAAPYFRVFNPVSQAKKFDPTGEYIAAFVPELASLPLPARFSPWAYPELAARLAPGYPAEPIVDLDEGRRAALEAYRLRGATQRAAVR